MVILYRSWQEWGLRAAFQTSGLGFGGLEYEFGLKVGVWGWEMCFINLSLSIYISTYIYIYISGIFLVSATAHVGCDFWGSKMSFPADTILALKRAMEI